MFGNKIKRKIEREKNGREENLKENKKIVLETHFIYFSLLILYVC